MRVPITGGTCCVCGQALCAPLPGSHDMRHGLSLSLSPVCLFFPSPGSVGSACSAFYRSLGPMVDWVRRANSAMCSLLVISPCVFPGCPCQGTGRRLECAGTSFSLWMIPQFCLPGGRCQSPASSLPLVENLSGPSLGSWSPFWTCTVGSALPWQPSYGLATILRISLAGSQDLLTPFEQKAG